MNIGSASMLPSIAANQARRARTLSLPRGHGVVTPRRLISVIREV